MSSRRVFGLVFALLMPAVACGSDDDDNKTSNPQQTCTPGQSVACAGPAACSGFQVCNQKGTGYGSCVCGSSGGSGGSISVGGNGSGGTSASGGTTSAGGATTCAPSSVASFTPKYVPARPKQNVCQPADVTDFFTRACHQGYCPEYLEGGAKVACGTCLAASPIADASYGPVVTLALGDVTSFETNSAGCVEIAGERACAEKIQAAQECARTSCIATCQPKNSAEYEQYSACQTAARTSTCKTFTDQAACLTTKASQLCGGSGDLFVVLGKAFCANP